MIAKDIVEVAQSVHKLIHMETDSTDDAVVILRIVEALLLNDQFQVSKPPSSAPVA